MGLQESASLRASCSTVLYGKLWYGSLLWYGTDSTLSEGEIVACCVWSALFHCVWSVAAA